MARSLRVTAAVRRPARRLAAPVGDRAAAARSQQPPPAPGGGPGAWGRAPHGGSHPPTHPLTPPRPTWPSLTAARSLKGENWAPGGSQAGRAAAAGRVVGAARGRQMSPELSAATIARLPHTLPLPCSAAWGLDPQPARLLPPAGVVQVESCPFPAAAVGPLARSPCARITPRSALLTGRSRSPLPRLPAGGRHIEGPVCKWKCDEDFDAHRWEDKFDCSINQFHELNHWVR